MLELLMLAQNPERIPSATGDIRVIESFASEATGRERRVQVWLPPGYSDSPEKSYPVLFLHDGQNVFDGATSYIPNQEWRCDETAAMLIKAGLVEPMIMVAVDNAGAARADEFLRNPIRGGRMIGGGKAHLYEKMLTDELLPQIRRDYRVSSGPLSVGALGSSFGGMISLHLGLSRPNIFGRIGVFSPSLWVNDGEMIAAVKSAEKLPERIYLDMGTAEGNGHIASRQLHEILQGMTTDSVYLEEEGGLHDEAAWARRFGHALLHLYPAQPKG